MELQIPRVYGITSKDSDGRLAETKLNIKAYCPLNFLSLLS
jgi:hypothetical protein